MRRTQSSLWLAEVRHSFDVLDGYTERFHRMRDATTAYVSLHPPEPIDLGQPDTGTTNSLRHSEISTARKALTDAARKFFSRCAELGLLPTEFHDSIDEHLGLPLYGYEHTFPMKDNETHST